MVRTIKNLPPFRTVDGRQIVSLWASRIFEMSGIKRLFGVNLVAAVLFTSVVAPEADHLHQQYALATRYSGTQVVVDPTTKTTFEMPLTKFKLSQSFSFWHPGIDMTAPKGTPVQVIDWGFVAGVEHSRFGYGQHVIVSHEHGINSLYAHLSEISVTVGQKIGRGDVIGKVGSTGWSSGNHLHLEIHREGKPLNPLELLPFKSQEIKYASASSITSSASAQPLASPL